MSSSEQVVQQFYTHFQNRNAAGMQACYHPKVQFSDPAFPHLEGQQVPAMWHMLLSGIPQDAEFRVTFDSIHTVGNEVLAHWEAFYTFSLTGKKVHNRIDARFRILDNRIVEHHDHFDFWRWSRMALGWKGILLGWSPLVRNRVVATANQRLQKFIAQHPEFRENTSDL